MYKLYSTGDGTLWHPCSYFQGEEISPSTETLNFLLVKKEAISLMRLIGKSKSKLCYDRRSVGQSVWVSRTHLGLTTTFLLVLLSNSCGFVDVRRSL
jgi:hypothetical protein